MNCVKVPLLADLLALWGDSLSRLGGMLRRRMGLRCPDSTHFTPLVPPGTAWSYGVLMGGGWAKWGLLDPAGDKLTGT